MKVATMAMQITSRNWSVAAAILGPTFASIPQPEVMGAYVIINTFESYRPASRRSSGAIYSRTINDLALVNIWVSSENFAAMYDYDRRHKSVDTFFEVDRVGDPQPMVQKREITLEERVDQLEENLNEMVQGS